MFGEVRLSTPRPRVAFACASMSMSSDSYPASATHAARLTAVVVLPTPPFWFAIAYTVPMAQMMLGRAAAGVHGVLQGRWWRGWLEWSGVVGRAGGGGGGARAAVRAAAPVAGGRWRRWLGGRWRRWVRPMTG